VTSLQQCELENYRVIVFRRDRAEILLIPHDGGFQLPVVDIPRWQRASEHVCDAVKSKWGCGAICLFTLQDVLERNSPGARQYQVMECWHDLKPRESNGLWMPIHSLSRHSFQDAEEYAALEHFLAKSHSPGEDPLPPFAHPFARPGWFRELRAWIADVIRPLGLRLNDAFRQINASPSFSLIRFETSGPAVWFKAVGHPNRHELRITLKLAELFPTYLPEIIGVQSDWNGWLSFEAEGVNLSESKEFRLWKTAAGTLARLQIDSIPKVREIAASGARDLRVSRLAAELTPFFAVMSELMGRQTKVPPPILSEADLRSLEEVLRDLLTQLQHSSPPDALGHLDFNPHNIVTSSIKSTFLDWAEAYIGNPVLTFQYLLEHFRRWVGADRTAESRLMSAYAEPWQDSIPGMELDEALRLSPLLAVLAFAVGNNAWRDQECLNDSATAGYLRSLTRRMHREAVQLNQRRSTCLC
jgi:hypothetical protein